MINERSSTVMDFMELIKTRVSIRKYRPDPVPEDVLTQILEAGRLAPSGKNIQPYYFIVVKDLETKKRLDLNRNTIEAPVIIVGVVNPTQGRCSVSDGILAFEHIILAAHNFGLGACWKGTYLGHMPVHAETIKKVLNVPDHYEVVAYTPLGYPDESPEPRRKRPFNEMIIYEKFE
jgi:nitroreductase